MNCREATELLPWLLNGTLETDERAELEAHLEVCAGCRAELRETQAAQTLFGGHPASGLLVDYVFDKPGVPSDLVEAHLGGCDRCAGELELLARSRQELIAEPASSAVLTPAPRQPQPAWRRAVVAAAMLGLVGLGAGLMAWGLLARQQRTIAAAEDDARQRIAQLETRLATAESRGDGSAAAELRGRLAELSARSEELAAQVAAGSRQIATLRQRLAELDGPRLNVPIHDLWPESLTLRGAAPEAVEVAAAPGPPATLILNSELERDLRVERLELVDDEGRLLHRLNGLRTGPGGGFSLSLPLAKLPRGRLRIHLYAPGQSEPLESYTFDLR